MSRATATYHPPCRGTDDCAYAGAMVCVGCACPLCTACAIPTVAAWTNGEDRTNNDYELIMRCPTCHQDDKMVPITHINDTVPCVIL